MQAERCWYECVPPHHKTQLTTAYWHYAAQKHSFACALALSFSLSAFPFLSFFLPFALLPFVRSFNRMMIVCVYGACGSLVLNVCARDYAHEKFIQYITHNSSFYCSLSLLLLLLSVITSLADRAMHAQEWERATACAFHFKSGHR